ncbi:hypothetical protein DAETH_28870 [Deinococcus aetherius]|uniref:HTH cro/C1-type domain-containing protein n=1 Tax=Deinococcus aetherius TaxID=200252 RepID=A0ABM8AGJ0_9DEIO|nr:hypothetical protein [Deinococcus aetherius]BDP42918.1 hypothetical protein DAETH_28870 [Deinococcus aetherius]
MPIRHELANVLSELLEAQNRPLAQVANELGYSRQRLHQLRTGQKSAAPEKIEEAINKLGYEVRVSAVPTADQ